MIKENKKGRLHIILYAYMLLILFILLVSATYTWFSISRTPRVSDMHLSVSSPTGLELAYEWNSEDEEWTQHLDLGSKINENIVPLKPVTWVKEENKFYAANYGYDGRITNVSKILTDEENANQTSNTGYYLKATFYARTGVNVGVSLAPAMVTGDGTEGRGTYVIGYPVWNETEIEHDNHGNGAENTIRIGFRITKLDKTGQEKADSVQFYVYEPNCNGHADGSTEVHDTHSIYGYPLVDKEYLIRQSVSTWSETNPTQRNVVIKELGEFLTDTNLFELSLDEFAKIDLYFWMEGQDIDCNQTIGQDAKILANIQFEAKTENQSGTEEFK